MSDIDEIRALCHKYAELVDRGDFAAVGTLLGRGTLTRVRPGAADRLSRGPEEIAAFYADHVQMHDGTPGTRHLISNLTVHVSEDGATATATSYLMVVQCLPDFPLQMIVAGRYHDAFEKADTWHFTDKKILGDFVGDLSRHAKV
jgi:hypothetical protein